MGTPDDDGVYGGGSSSGPTGDTKVPSLLPVVEEERVALVSDSVHELTT